MKNYDLLIKNGTVVTTTDMFQCDIAVKDGKIAAMQMNMASDEAENVYDAKGKLVLPGALDVHTHLQMPFGGTVSADSYLSGTRAAACGGVTTIFDYPVQRAGQSIIELVNSKKDILEEDACVDYAMHCCITDLNGGEILKEMEQAVAEGITSYKCFLVYKKEGMMVDDGTLARLLLRAKEVGALINIHAENPDLIDLTDADANSDANSCADTNADSDANTDADADTNSDADANSDANSSAGADRRNGRP